MHPSVNLPEPGSCPICNMALVPVYAEEPAGSGGTMAGMAGLVTALLATVSVALFIEYGVGSVILPSLTIFSLGLAVHLVMLGIIAENALHQRRGLYRAATPMATEVGRHDPEEN